MEFIKGVTFGYMSKRGEWEYPQTFESLQLLKERCSINTVILPIVVEQDTIHSEEINWQADSVLSDKEVIKMIEYIHKMDLRVILKPMLNVSDGTWRAHINFFDYDVPCEPKWSAWFANYKEFVNHYANIAEQTKCEMFVIGCEMVNSDRRETEWRNVIQEVRLRYSGLITYNCDKYQEDRLTWWDAVDVISSSGYYPIGTWPKQLDRIQKVVEREAKPFFFCEVGCASRTGAKFLPNDWALEGKPNLKEQEDWYQDMFAHTSQRSWVSGYGLWDWKAHLYALEKVEEDMDYALYGKPAERVVKHNFSKIP
ncbi:glycoside hydrolase family 113 [Jeotgalibaca caeni]|uniref:glycoside hydrolase family 113 n=1 Tax=Jeotgalibaca caeni TaxID=3028623 RepID=UPI00237DF7E6|nr:1,4-beta-xylanase [Jeotgalibaca caeni]MDE1549916.1 1,4-beta-xylanase [Jeotgalibaca caeni]